MNEEQQRILDYLNKNAVGYTNCKTSETIRTFLDLPSGGKTYEFVRELIRDMILARGSLIGSSSKGYWIIQNHDELDKAINHLNSRVREINVRVEALRQNWESENE